MKVLIVKLSSLGDVVHAMPVVHDMRQALAGKKLRIDWVVERGFAPLVARCEGVNKVIPCALRQWRKAPLSSSTRAEWKAFKAQLQAEAYDAVIDLQGLSKSALVSWLARTTPNGKRYAMAHATDGSSFEAPARWVADQAVTMEPHVHAVQRSRLLCAAALGYEVSGAPKFGLRAGTAAAQAGDANPFAPRKPVVALVHGTSRADKQWTVANWIALGQRLNASGFGVALAHGSAGELATSEAIATQLQDAKVWPMMGLDALTDTMATCCGVIGVDSGLSHIAVALDLPCVQLYNFDTAWRTGPVANPGARLQRQVSVFANPHPELDAVWRAWEALDTPAVCPRDTRA